MRILAVGFVALLSTLRPLASDAAEAALAPFVAEYDVRYGRMGVGNSRTELSRAAPPGAGALPTELVPRRMETPPPLRTFSFTSGTHTRPSVPTRMPV